MKVNLKSHDQLINNQRQLTGYLMHLRQKKKPASITIQFPSFSDKASFKQRTQFQKASQTKVGQYVQSYINILRQVTFLDNYATKKIFKSILHFLEEFPTMSFLYQVISAFGKVQKKLSMNEAMLMAQATDQMVPLFQKIIEKIQFLRKQSQSKKLMQLGHRIQHLQDMIRHSKANISSNDPEISRIFKKFEPDRVQKYVIMEDGINKAQKRFGNFSQNFIKNREIFSNLNRVYQDIKKHEKYQSIL